MASYEQNSSEHTQETETYSDAEMSANAASEAVAIANQQGWSENKKSDLDELLDEIDQHLETEELVHSFRQKGGQ